MERYEASDKRVVQGGICQFVKSSNTLRCFILSSMSMDICRAQLPFGLGNALYCLVLHKAAAFLPLIAHQHHQIGCVVLSGIHA